MDIGEKVKYKDKTYRIVQINEAGINRDDPIITLGSGKINVEDVKESELVNDLH